MGRAGHTVYQLTHSLNIYDFSIRPCYYYYYYYYYYYLYNVSNSARHCSVICCAKYVANLYKLCAH